MTPTYAADAAAAVMAGMSRACAPVRGGLRPGAAPWSRIRTFADAPAKHDRPRRTRESP